MLRLTLSSVLVLAPLVAAQEPEKPTSRPAGEAAVEMGWTGVLGEEEFRKLHQLKEGEAPALEGTDIEVGGQVAYLSLPAGKPPFPAVIVIHEWWGLNDHIKHWADRLAADGYAALAVDLYGGKVATDRRDALSYMKSVDQDAALKTMQAAHRFLAEDARVRANMRACIGWCFGGGQALNLAIATPDLDAAVIYYGRLVTDPAKLRGINARLLGVFGNKDKGIPPSAVDAFTKALDEAKRQYRIFRYDADHAFANPSSARYDTKSASAAWREVRRFLADVRKETKKAKAPKSGKDE